MSSEGNRSGVVKLMEASVCSSELEKVSLSGDGPIRGGFDLAIRTEEEALQRACSRFLFVPEKDTSGLSNVRACLAISSAFEKDTSGLSSVSPALENDSSGLGNIVSFG